METNLILEGFKFMGLGMATVFTFLVILILMINLMSIIIHKYFPEPQAGNVITNAPTASANKNNKDNKKIIAAITAAITRHRQA